MNQDITLLEGTVIDTGNGNPFFQVNKSTPGDFIVHGRIPLTQNFDGSYSARQGEGTLYDFNHEPGGRRVRNALTWIGKHVSGYEKPFQINYQGSVNAECN